MLKACTLFRFKQGSNPEDAQRYWRTTHGDVLRGYPFYKRYVQSDPILAAGLNTNLPYDGLAEVWVESTQVLRNASAGEGYQAITADEAKFIDRRFTDVILVEDNVIVDLGAKPEDIKLVHLFKRAPGIDPIRFQRDWLGHFQEAMVRARVPSKLVVSLSKLAGYRGGREPKWDVIVTEWHSSLASLPKQTSPLKQEVMSSVVVTMATREYLIAEF
jgi:uncharacterized protein (TIGR02118 family)